jgi:uncharacterized membrane protein
MMSRDSTAVRLGSAVLAVAVLVAAVRAARRRRRAWLAMGRYEERTTTETVTVPASTDRVYWLWRELPTLARLLDERAQVEIVDDGLSRWELAGVGCTVEITGDLPEEVISWRVPDGPLPHEGTVRLSPIGGIGTGGTRIEVRLWYRWSSRWAKAAGVADSAPGDLLRQALHRYQLQVSGYRHG